MCHLRRRERICELCGYRVFITMDRKKCLKVKLALTRKRNQWASCGRNDPLTYKTELGLCERCALLRS